MIETIAAVNQAVNSFIWGIPAMVCIIGVGLLLSVRTGFLQIRKFPYAIRTTVGRMFRKRDASDGAMTPFQAVCTALAGTVGTGNIAGVAGAIAIGGPGAVFWMWCSALLGMCTKFAEVTLAVHFRERSDTGEWVGGPMYYIKNGLGRRWQFLAVLYALFGVLTVFGTGNATQVNTIVAAVDTALLEAYNTLKIKEKNRSAEMMRMLEIKEESPKMETVQYYWLDDLVDRVEFKDDTMKVFWKCGLTNKVDMIIPKNRKPEVIAKRYCAMQDRILESANKPVVLWKLNKPRNGGDYEELKRWMQQQLDAQAKDFAARQAAMNLRSRQKGKVANDN